MEVSVVEAERERERERARESKRIPGSENTREERVGYGFESVKMRGRQPLVKEKYINSKAR